MSYRFQIVLSRRSSSLACPKLMLKLATCGVLSMIKCMCRSIRPRFIQSSCCLEIHESVIHTMAIIARIYILAGPNLPCEERAKDPILGIFTTLALRDQLARWLEQRNVAAFGRDHLESIWAHWHETNQSLLVPGRTFDWEPKAPLVCPREDCRYPCCGCHGPYRDSSRHIEPAQPSCCPVHTAACGRPLSQDARRYDICDECRLP
mmetsp:Transcript_16186/g.44551  ORF Transcript_16186/g.44551 Transcript_16186/m.44551 type:complete len:206 (-) Transcript_16186:257-874(-)